MNVPVPEAVFVIVNAALAAVAEVIVGEMFKTTVVPVPVEVPEIVIVPDVVIGLPDTESQAGTARSTEETYTIGATYDKTVPLEVSTVSAAPTVVSPVPPEVVGMAVPE